MPASTNQAGPLTTTILVAEDDGDLRSLYARCLRKAGHVVWEAADGGEVLRLVRAHSPELVLLDIWMPVLNGLEVLENLRGNAEAIGVKVVVLSQQDDADTHLEGLALGIEDYWTKDLSLEELCDRVHELVRLAATPPSPAE